MYIYVCTDEIIPNDGIPIEKVVKVSLGLSVLYMILATAGIMFAVACLTFILHFRTKMQVILSITTCIIYMQKFLVKSSLI